VPEWESNDFKDKDILKRAAAFNLIYAASRKYKNKHFKDEQEVRLMTTSHHTWGLYTNSSSMFEDDSPIHYRTHSAYNMPVPYVKFFIEDVETQKNKQTAVAQETSVQMKERKLSEERNKKRLLLPITEILIGPMIHQKKAETACKILLKDKGYEDVVVKISDIPYRGF